MNKEKMDHYTTLDVYKTYVNMFVILFYLCKNEAKCLVFCCFCTFILRHKEGRRMTGLARNP